MFGAFYDEFWQIHCTADHLKFALTPRSISLFHMIFVLYVFCFNDCSRVDLYLPIRLHKCTHTLNLLYLFLLIYTMVL